MLFNTRDIGTYSKSKTIKSKSFSIRVASTLIFCLGLFFIKAQDVTNLLVDQTANGMTMDDWVKNYESKLKLDFLFEDNMVLQKNISGVTIPVPLLSFLKTQLPGSYIKLLSPKVILILEGNNTDEVESETEELLIYPVRKEGGIIKGKIYDEESNEPIIGANVLFTKTVQGTTTNESGIFITTTDKDILRTEISYVGYKKQLLWLIATNYASSSVAHIPIRISFDQLETILLLAQRSDANISNQRTGVQKLKMGAIKQLPTFLGEVDPIKGVTTLPGVSSTGDLAAGFNVRGGATGQNLILQDGAIIFNPTHLFGFFSAFNPDFISDISLLKGGGPALYGGRVASTLNINTRNGDLTKYKLSGGIGLISSRLTFEGPVRKNRSSFILGGRFSYSDWFIHSYEDIQLKNSFANFYDLSAKYFQKINDNNFISTSAYYSFDDFNIGIDSTFSWATKNFSFKWGHITDKDNRSYLSFASSNYKSGVLYDNEIFGFNYRNGITVWTADFRHEYDYSSRIRLEAGLNNNYTEINPGESTPYSEGSNSIPVKLNTQKILESALFVEGSFEISDRWAFTAGVRYGQFFRFGEDVIFTLDYNDIEGRTPAIKDTLHFSKNEIVAGYGGLEPRLSFRYLLDKTSSLKASYNRTQQFIHQISTTTTPSPVDFWISSSPVIRPQRSDQFSLGYFKNFKDNLIESSIEVYYKLTKNTLDYIAGVDLNLNRQLEAGLAQGKGYAYGLEFLLKKKRGKINGWVAYSFARSFRKFTGQVPELAINGGKRYPSVFDQPHQLSLVLNIRLGIQTIFSSNFTYNSGRPLTIPVSKYAYEHILSVNNYSNRNEFRGPAYHRLDLSLKIEGKNKPGKIFTGDFLISVYNIYSRKNAYAIFFNKDGQAYKTSILGSAIPSVSYNFKIN